MSLLLWDKWPPYLAQLACPFIWPFFKDIVRHHVIVADIRNDWNRGFVLAAIFLLSKHLQELVYHSLIEFLNLLFRARMAFIIVMAGRISGPNNKINLISEISLDPIKCLI